MSIVYPRYCPVCVSTPREYCFREWHVTRCERCGWCYCPSLHGGCIACSEISSPQWDHDYWLSWWEELSRGVDDYIQERVAGIVALSTTGTPALDIHGCHD